VPASGMVPSAKSNHAITEPSGDHAAASSASSPHSSVRPSACGRVAPCRLAV
jgi:hypothetical protein